MAQLQNMIHAAVAPLQAEMMETKKVMDEDLDDQSETDTEDNEEEDDEQRAAAQERDSANAAWRRAEPLGEPASRRSSGNSRSPRR